MKRYIKSSVNTDCLKFNIIFDIELPYTTDDLSNRKIAASNYKGFDIPDGPLIPSEKDALIDTQILADYHSFVESISALLAKRVNRGTAALGE
mgnify:CR=1 FL=1